MPLIDTHAHLDEHFRKGSLAETVACAQAARVIACLVPATEPDTLQDVLAVANAYPDWAFPMVGLHPTYLADDTNERIARLRQALVAEPERYCAIGECGLDLYWRNDNLEAQQQVLEEMAQWAVEFAKPLVIHSRDALQPCLEVLQAFKGQVWGVFHCFSGSVPEAEAIIELGYALGIGGNITYKSNPTIKTLRTIGLEHVVLETDAPYLAPIPFRGKPNEPAYVSHTCTFVANALGLDKDAVAAQTTALAKRIFAIG